MTFVSNVKRRVCWSFIVIAFFAMCFLAGCGGSKLTTRAYPLGRYPEVTKKIVSEIVSDDLVKHRHAEQRRSGRMLYETFDDHIVAKTTAEGHRQIEASLKNLEGQSTAPSED